MFKKISYILLGSLLSQASIAGSMAQSCDSKPIKSSLSCESEWDFAVDALYLQSSYDADKAYGSVSPPGAATQQYQELPNAWNWGYRLEGAYVLNTGNDFSISYTYYHSPAERAGYWTTLPSPLSAQTPFSVSNTTHLEQVHLTWGQKVDLTAHQKLYFRAGIHYAFIQSNAIEFYAATVNPFDSLQGFKNSNYKGIGPAFGFDYHYELIKKLELMACGSASMLYGGSRLNTGVMGLPTQLVINQSEAAAKNIVPGMQAQLGLNYSIKLGQEHLNLEIGYQIINYFYALEVLVDNEIHDVSNGEYGPYLGVRYAAHV